MKKNLKYSTSASVFSLDYCSPCNSWWILCQQLGLKVDNWIYPLSKHSCKHKNTAQSDSIRINFVFFSSQIQSHLVNDKDQGPTGTGAVSVKIEGLNPPPVVSPDWGVNSTFVKNANPAAGNDSKFGASVIRDSETSNRNLHRNNDGKTKAAPAVEGKRPESDFRSISSSSHGSFVVIVIVDYFVEL